MLLEDSKSLPQYAFVLCDMSDVKPIDELVDSLPKGAFFVKTCGIPPHKKGNINMLL